MSTILCDGAIIDEIIDDFGTDIVIISVATTYEADEYHETVETETRHYIKGMVENISSEEDRVKEGLFQSGDIYVHLKIEDQQYADIGNYILYGGDKYQIKLINKEQRGDVIYTSGVGASIYQRNVS